MPKPPEQTKIDATPKPQLANTEPVSHSVLANTPVPVANTVANTDAPLANTKTKDGHDREARRTYMREYMKQRRATKPSG